MKKTLIIAMLVALLGGCEDDSKDKTMEDYGIQKWKVEPHKKGSRYVVVAPFAATGIVLTFYAAMRRRRYR